MIEIEDLKKMNLDKNDILVFQMDHDVYFTPPTFIKKRMISFFRELRYSIKNKFIVIPSSIKMGVVSKDEKIEESSDCKEINLTEVLFDPNNLDMK